MKGNTKKNILRAAIKIFARRGMKAATVREVGVQASAANRSAVTYHFKGKENLYKNVLEFMFKDANKCFPEEETAAKETSPEEKLRIFILTFMRIIYVLETELDSDLASFFPKEVTHPSPFLTEMVGKCLTPGSETLQEMLFEILGKKTPFDVGRDCEDSVMGQIYYRIFGAMHLWWDITYL